MSIASLIVFSAIFPLFAFYFMDRLWYHRLLEGSVAAGIEAESALKHLGYKVDLGSKISEYSPFTLWLTSGTKIHSKTKMDIFYLMLVAALLIVAVCLGFGIRHQTVLAPAPTASVVAPPPGVAMYAIAGLARYLALEGVTADQLAQFVERHMAEQLRDGEA